MIRTQVQLPDALYQEAKRIARQQEMTLAEVLRRGVEHMARLYPPSEGATASWKLPPARAMGRFRAAPGNWRELANPPPET